MQKLNKLAVIVNNLSKGELANLSPHAALSLLRAVRGQPRTRESAKALQRLTMHLLRGSPRLGDGVPSCIEYLLGARRCRGAGLS